MDKAIRILRLLLAVLVVLLVGWAVVFSGGNLGELFRRILRGRRRRTAPVILDEEGEAAGVAAVIVRNPDPARDPSVLRLADGTEIELPDGLRDEDVEEVYLTDTEVVSVKVNHARFSDLFDARRGGSGGAGGGDPPAH